MRVITEVFSEKSECNRLNFEMTFGIYFFAGLCYKKLVN